MRVDGQRAERHQDLLGRGGTRGALRGPRFERRSHGLYRRAGVDLDLVDERVDDAVGLLLPSCALGGWAALRLQGNDFFDGWSPGGVRRALVHCLPGSQLRRRDAVEPFRGLVHPDELLHLEGVAMATPARAVFDEARLARTLTGAVVAMDMALSTTHGRPRTTPAAVSLVVASHHKVRGIVRARRALALASTRSASPGESAVRMLARAAGLTGLLVNAPLFSPFGELLGVADLFDPESGLVIESDGSEHREAEQHAEDNRREERFERHGAVVCRVSGPDHARPFETQARMVAAQVQAKRSRIRRWTLDTPAWWADWPAARRWL